MKDVCQTMKIIVFSVWVLVDLFALTIIYTNPWALLHKSYYCIRDPTMCNMKLSKSWNYSLYYSSFYNKKEEKKRTRLLFIKNCGTYKNTIRHFKNIKIATKCLNFEIRKLSFVFVFVLFFPINSLILLIGNCYIRKGFLFIVWPLQI